MDTKIELTEKQIAILKQHLDGKFDPFSASEEDQSIMGEVIDKADALMVELEAFDEIGGDLMQWFWEKYQAQEAEK